MPWVRRVLVLVVGFRLFYLVSRPEAAAGGVPAVLAAIAGAFGAVVVFFTPLAG